MNCGGQRLRHAEGRGVGQRDDATSSDGITTKFVAAPEMKAPEWLYVVRPDEVTDTLNP